MTAVNALFIALHDLGPGEVPRDDVLALMAERGFSPSSIRKAKGALHVRTRKTGQPGDADQAWFWSLPTACPTCQRPYDLGLDLEDDDLLAPRGSDPRHRNGAQHRLSSDEVGAAAPSRALPEVAVSCPRCGLSSLMPRGQRCTNIGLNGRCTGTLG